MKGVILHGGNGTRLRPFTYSDVKQLLPVAGKPISEYALENLIEIGIREINIVVGHVGGEEVKKYYGDGSKWGVNITYTYQEKASGIAHAIGLTKDFVKEDSFVVFLADNFVQDGISKLYNHFMSGRFDGMLALIHVDNPTQFGVAEIGNDGEVIRLAEKPQIPKSDLAIVGVYFLTHSIFRYIHELKPSGRGEYEITDAYQKMIESNLKVSHSIISGWFKDTGTVADFLECNRLVLDKLPEGTGNYTGSKNIHGRVRIDKSATISEDTTVLGPCYIGSETVIENSYIGPFTSIGSGCRVRNAEIGNTVIMDGAELVFDERYHLRESMVGSKAKIRSNSGNSKTIRAVLGRDSNVEVS